jgi:hypothetical protein
VPLDDPFPLSQPGSRAIQVDSYVDLWPRLDSTRERDAEGGTGFAGNGPKRRKETETEE